jgi:hypothetical protein
MFKFKGSYSINFISLDLQADYKEREEDFVRGYDIMTSLA